VKSLIKGYRRGKRLGYTGVENGELLVQLSSRCPVEVESVGIEALKARTTVK
jgi:hypothetical protein